MFAILAAIVALQTAPQAGTAEVQAQPAPPAPATRATSRRPSERPVCENRPRTGGVLRRQICVSSQQATAQHSVAKQYVEDVTSGIAHERLPLGGSGGGPN